MFVEYIKTRPGEIEAAIKEFPCALVPIGSLEWHGPHLPLGLDGIKADALLHLTAEKLNKGVLFPCVFFGAYDTIGFPYTFHFSKSGWQKQFAEFMDQLYKTGFKIIVFITGHYPGTQVKHIRELATKMMKKVPDVSILAIPDHHLLLDLGYTGDHAARGETALALALFPELVDLNTLPANLSREERGKKFGVWGEDPWLPETDSWGETLKTQFQERLVAKIEEVWTKKSQEPFLTIYREVDRIQNENRIKNKGK